MDKNDFLKLTANYLKFYNEHYNYEISDNELIDNRSGDRFFKILKDNETEKPLPDLKRISHVHNDDESKIAEDIGLNNITKVWKGSQNLETFSKLIRDCPKCLVLAETRKQIVFGTGNPNADIVIVGEAPGADEDEQGKPFVGRAGKLLTDILKAINFSREEVYICNILKCRPPANRNPLPEEIINCEPYLYKQLEMIKPKMILALGTLAAQTLLRSKETLGKMRGKFHTYNGIKMMVTFHPAALLRNPGWKKPTWEDVQLFRTEYEKMIKQEAI
ncbi:MAG: uracil-DNA glycosylase [Ignavibacteria bacterium]